MIETIITYGIVFLVGAIVGIFIYRNNEDLFSSKADRVDKLWDDLELTDKFDNLKEALKDAANKQ